MLPSNSFGLGKGLRTGMIRQKQEAPEFLILSSLIFLHSSYRTCYLAIRLSSEFLTVSRCIIIHPFIIMQYHHSLFQETFALFFVAHRGLAVTYHSFLSLMVFVFLLVAILRVHSNA